jgi:hypothetical protein
MPPIAHHGLGHHKQHHPGQDHPPPIAAKRRAQAIIAQPFHRHQIARKRHEHGHVKPIEDPFEETVLHPRARQMAQHHQHHQRALDDIDRRIAGDAMVQLRLCWIST